eukprot:3779956-Alexandrium_andersonii.AAC.1
MRARSLHASLGVNVRAARTSPFWAWTSTASFWRTMPYGRALWRQAALVCARRFHADADLVLLYKAH